MQYILSIDQGTTGSRAVIYTKGGAVKASAYEEFPQYFPKPGWVEHDPEEIYKSVINSVEKVLKKVPDIKIAAIGITNQRETTVVWERHTGKPVYNAIVWQCRRTSERCDRLNRKKGEAALFRKKTGLPIDAYFSATKIEWILDNVPGARKKAQNGMLCFGTTDSWILWRLAGGKTHATDYTNASRTMLFNIETLRWDDELLKKFRIPSSMLPDVLPSSGVFGNTKKIKRLPAGIPIAGIAGDQQAALFGQGCFEPGTSKNTYGTGCFVLLNTGRKRVASKSGLISSLACGKRGEPVYALEGAIFVAGAAVQWIRDGLGIIKSASQTEEMARNVADNAGVYFVPAFVGMGAPYWDQQARGAVLGITRGTKKEHIVRAALEAMCYQTKDVLIAMEKDSRLKIKSLKVDGGAVANRFLCQFQSDVLGIPVIRPKVIESTSLGVAYLAGLAVGFYKSTEEVKKYWKKDKEFKPRISKAASAALYKDWQKAVSRVLTK